MEMRLEGKSPPGVESLLQMLKGVAEQHGYSWETVMRMHGLGGSSASESLPEPLDEGTLLRRAISAAEAAARPAIAPTDSQDAMDCSEGDTDDESDDRTASVACSSLRVHSCPISLDSPRARSLHTRA